MLWVSDHWLLNTLDWLWRIVVSNNLIIGYIIRWITQKYILTILSIFLLFFLLSLIEITYQTLRIDLSLTITTIHLSILITTSYFSRILQIAIICLLTWNWSIIEIDSLTLRCSHIITAIILCIPKSRTILISIQITTIIVSPSLWSFSSLLLSL